MESIEGVSCILRSAGEVKKDDFISSSGIIAGSPVYFGTMAAELKAVFDNFVSVRKRMENKIGAAFATSGHQSGGKETTVISIIQAFLIYGMVVVGDPMDASGHYGVSYSGHPDEKIKKDSFKLGQRVALLATKLQS